MTIVAEAVAVKVGFDASSSSSSDDSCAAPAPKRPRREPAQPETHKLSEFPPGCSVLIPRHYEGQSWNEYCEVMEHTSDGQLLLDVPGESEPLRRGVHGLRSGLGDDRRPLKKIGSASSSSASGLGSGSASGSARGGPSSAAEPALSPPEESLQTAAEQLESSELRRSGGRTRSQLNAHLASLRLHVSFGVPVVSQKDGRVSHLTFNIGPWNDLPCDGRRPFEWWLGEGEGRLKQASMVNPELAEQPEGGLPVFFAVKQKRKGGNLCHYGGHFTTGGFQMLAERPIFKGEARQARIELHFHHFDDALGAAVDAIPVELGEAI